MSFYAVLGLVEVIGKLLIVYMVAFLAMDRLIAYSMLLIMLTSILLLVYYLYCKKNFKLQTTYSRVIDRELFKKIAAFSGWSLLGNVALVGSNQGLNILKNMFFGVVVNAAMGIAYQVNTAVYSFVSNFQTAFTPQVTQSYAENDFEKHRKLVLQSSKFSFFMLLVISVPIFINTEFILTLWLKSIPAYTVEFVQLILIISLIDALANPFWMSAAAAGNIRNYQIAIASILILNLPLSYIFLKMGSGAAQILVIKVLLQFIMYLFRFFYVRSRVEFSAQYLFRYFVEIIVVSLLVSAMVYTCRYVINLPENLPALVLVSLLSGITTLGVVWWIGLTSAERVFLLKMFRKK